LTTWGALRKVCRMDTRGASSLTPTLWRTCRALANRRRLQMLRYLLLRKDAVRVTEMARDVGAPLSLTSEYLRALNARGLLTPVRQGRQVLYRAQDDPTLPEARILLHALRLGLAREEQWVKTAFDALTGFTHPRRIAMVQAVARGAFRVADICDKTGVSRRAVARHLNKLVRRGYLGEIHGNYRVVRPAPIIARSLLSLALRAR
jgi:DNA-binding transcriptional ArsR family regulator